MREAQIRGSLSTIREELGDSHPRTLRTATQLAEVLTQQGKEEEANVLLGHAFLISHHLYPR